MDCWRKADISLIPSKVWDFYTQRLVDAKKMETKDSEELSGTKIAWVQKWQPWMKRAVENKRHSQGHLSLTLQSLHVQPRGPAQHKLSHEQGKDQHGVQVTLKGPQSCLAPAVAPEKCGAPLPSSVTSASPRKMSELCWPQSHLLPSLPESPSLSLWGLSLDLQGGNECLFWGAKWGRMSRMCTLLP